MAIAIKSIPVLESDEAKAFIRKADAKSKKSATVDFSNQAIASNAILGKAKLH